MAIAITRKTTSDGITVLRVRLTAQTDTSTETIPDMPVRGRIIRRVIALVSGTGSAIDPVLHRSSTLPTSATAVDVIEHPLQTTATYTGSATAAANVGSTSEVPYECPDGVWYLTPQANDATADHVVDAEYVIRGY